MRVRITQGESAGELLELPADFARKLIILGLVVQVAESDIETASIRPPENAALRRFLDITARSF